MNDHLPFLDNLLIVRIDDRRLLGCFDLRRRFSDRLFDGYVPRFPIEFIDQKVTTFQILQSDEPRVIVNDRTKPTFALDQRLLSEFLLGDVLYRSYVSNNRALIINRRTGSFADMADFAILRDYSILAPRRDKWKPRGFVSRERLFSVPFGMVRRTVDGRDGDTCAWLWSDAAVAIA